MNAYRQFLGVVTLGILSGLTLPVGGAQGSYKLLKEIPIGGDGGLGLPGGGPGRRAGSTSATPRRWW